MQSTDKYVTLLTELVNDQIALAGPARAICLLPQNIIARMFGQVLYDVPVRFSGLASEKLIQQKVQSYYQGMATHTICKDHFYGRQNGGNELVNLIHTHVKANTVASVEEVNRIVEKYRQVHYVTSDENTKLRPDQQRCSPEAAYRRAGIKLLPASNLFKRGRLDPAVIREWANILEYSPSSDDVSVVNVTLIR